MDEKEINVAVEVGIMVMPVVVQCSHAKRWSLMMERLVLYRSWEDQGGGRLMW